MGCKRSPVQIRRPDQSLKHLQASIARRKTRSQISAILSLEQLVDQLIRQMHRTGVDEDPRLARIAEVLKRFTAGFLA